MISFPTAQSIAQGMQANPSASTIPDTTNPGVGPVQAHSGLSGMSAADQAQYLTSCGMNPDVAPSAAQWAECYEINEGETWTGPYAVTGIVGSLAATVPQYVWWALGAAAVFAAYKMVK